MVKVTSVWVRDAASIDVDYGIAADSVLFTEAALLSNISRAIRQAGLTYSVIAVDAPAPTGASYPSGSMPPESVGLDAHGQLYQGQIIACCMVLALLLVRALRQPAGYWAAVVSWDVVRATGN